MEELDELKKQFVIILNALENHGGRSDHPQIIQIKKMLNLIDSPQEVPIKIDRLKELNKALYTPHGGLAEFFIWDDDFDKRIKINEKLDYAKNYTWKKLNL